LLRKLVLLGSTAALICSSLFIAGSANAGATKVDVSGDSITCDTLYATTMIKPSLTFTGSATAATQILLKGTIGGCTVTGPNAANAVTGSFTAKLAGVGANCNALAGTSTATGPLVIKWKSADLSTPLLQTSSTVNVTSITGNVHGETLNGGSQTYGDFVIHSSSVSGAFTGGDNGASSKNEGVTSEDALNNLFGQCGSALGLKVVHIGLGEITLA
jgi:hypothetical protein